jgi:ribosomal protein L40E
MNWQFSRNGNLTCLLRGRLRCTIYPVGTQYKYVFNIGDKEPHFSEPYDTRQEAQVACESHVREVQERRYNHKLCVGCIDDNPIEDGKCLRCIVLAH